MKTRFLFLLLTLISFIPSYGQLVVKGKITDAETGDPIPFASVLLQGTSTGISTDFEGNYLLESNNRADSLEVTYIGYNSITKAIGPGNEHTINFQLRPSDYEMEAFVFEAGENPAFDIIRKAVDKRKSFDKRKLDAYQTKNYTKIEIDIDHVSEAFTKRKAVKKSPQFWILSSN